MRFFVVAEGAVPGVDLELVSVVIGGVIPASLFHDGLVIFPSIFFDVYPFGFDPPEIFRVDVCGEAAAEAVELIRTYEVHFAGEDGVISGAGEVVGKCGDV